MSEWSVIKRFALVTGVLLAALNYVALVRLGFAGQVPDLNPLGASAGQIIDFRAALGFEGRELFNKVYRPLDFAFLLCLSFVLCLIARALRPRRFWWAIILFATIFCASDLTENQLMAEFVNAVPEPRDTELPEQINLATRVKFAAVFLAAASLITCWRQERGQA